MKLLQINGGFTQEELLAYRYIVYGNCLTQMKILVNSAQKLGIDLESEENKVLSWHSQVSQLTLRRTVRKLC